MNGTANMRFHFLCDRKFLSHKMLRKDALLRCHFGRSKSEVHRTSCSLAEMKYMLRIPLGRERVASDSFSIVQLSIGFKYGKMKYSCRTTLL